MKIRPLKSDDIVDLQTVLVETELFPSDMLPNMVSAFLSGDESADIWLTCEADGKAVGLCNAVPEAFAEGAWNMRAIAVLPALQRGGFGAAIVRQLEEALKERRQRILIVDTSGTDEFAPTREFYRKNGYAEEARIRDFWATGDDKVTFWKSLT